MPRPEEKTLGYIQVDTVDKTTLKRLTRKFGKEGRLFWWELLRLSARTNGYLIDMSNELDQEDIFEFELFVDKDTGLKIVDFLIKNGNIDQETWEKDRCIWIENLIARHSHVFVKRNAVPENPKKTKPVKKR